MAVEGYTVVQAFYMTIITVSTVGFGEIKQFSDEGRLFASFLIITSFGTFAYALGSITQHFVSGDYKKYLKNYKVDQAVSKLTNHVVVCGYGRNGKQAAATLSAFNEKFVVVESKPDMINEMKLNRILFVEGDATIEENLKLAQIEHAKALISTLPNDADNVFVVLTAREINKKINIISRASLDSSESKLRIAGANNIVMPDKIGGAHMAEMVVTPDVIAFLDHVSIQGPGKVNISELEFKDLPENFQHKTIRELNDGYHTGALIVGFRTSDGAYMVNPDQDLKLVPNSKLFVLGTSEQINELNQLFGKPIIK